MAEVTEEEFLAHLGVTSLDELDGTFIESTENSLEQSGVKGMRWGKTTAGKAGQNPNSFLNSPSAAKAVLLGSYGKKSAYTNPAALVKRQKAGKQRIAAILLGAGSLGLSAATAGNPSAHAGASIVSGIMSTVGAGLSIASVMNGAQGAHEEQQSRLK